MMNREERINNVNKFFQQGIIGWDTQDDVDVPYYNVWEYAPENPDSDEDGWMFSPLIFCEDFTDEEWAQMICDHEPVTKGNTQYCVFQEV